MRVWLPIGLAALMSVSACAQERPDVQTVKPVAEAPVQNTNQAAPTPVILQGETIPDVLPQASPLSCEGVEQQGGAVLCQTVPNAKVKIGRSETDFYYENADNEGRLIIGFDRDEVHTFVEFGGRRVSFELTPRDYDISRIDGLPPSQVSSFNEQQLKRIRSSSARKSVGFSSRAKEVGLKDGFIFPLKTWNKSSPFGAQRILNGEAKRPHYGVDIAAPVGTPIYAPADGIVSLADDDLYFEGAMVMLDHGQGLNSMYLHVSEIYVEAGQAVKQGEKIAAIGSRGRSTGPHLCWRMKWRNRNLDPELLTKWPGRESSANISYGSGHSDEHNHSHDHSHE